MPLLMNLFNSYIALSQLFLNLFEHQQQSYHQFSYFIKEHMDATLTTLSIINKQNQNRDLTYFDSLWSSQEQQLMRTLQFQSSNWQSFFPFHERLLQNFQDLLDCKIMQVQHYQLLFPGLPSMMQTVTNVNQYKGDRRKVSVSEKITDLVFKHFIYDIVSRKQRNGIYYCLLFGRKVSLNEYINLSPIYYQAKHPEQFDIRWRSILSRTQHQLQMKKGDADTDTEFIRQIQKERLLSINCLGCCPFFYAGCNISNPAINSTPLVHLGPISRIRQLLKQLKDEACLLLNSHGGVIVFDCAIRNKEVIPVGDLMSPQLKQEIQQTIISYLTQCIFPSIETSNYSVSFVPIIKNPMEGTRMAKKVVTEGSYETTYYQRQFIEGYYVTRIKINPTVPERVYFWINQQKPIFPQRVDATLIPIPAYKIHKIIKKKFKTYYFAEGTEDWMQNRFLSPKISYFHDGECLRPEVGIQLAKQETTFGNLAEKYKYVSLLNARKSDLMTIKTRLQKRGIACEIQSKFQNYRFKMAMGSSLIHHNMRFDLLLNEISHKKDFQFGGNFITLLCITSFVKLTERNTHSILPQETFNNICNSFSKEFPVDQIRLWKYSSQEGVEFYFKASARVQTVFLFYLLNQMGERATLKNPKNFDKLTQGDINKRFFLFYPRHQELKEPVLKEELKNVPQ